jgi:ATP-dependent RNA helicase DeaD
MHQFRRRSIHLLVATDVAARGLDVEGISHIIHYHLPDAAETYTHRSGRTARAGRSGASIVLATPKEVPRLRAMERTNAMRFDFADIPGGREICEKQCNGFVERLLSLPVDRQAVASYLPRVCDALSHLTREELIGRTMTADIGRLVETYRGAADINTASRPAVRTPNTGGSQCHPGRTGFHKFFIDVGRLDNIDAGAVVRLVCDHCRIDSRRIGRIDIKREFSFFEVDRRIADTVRRSLKNVRLDGRRVQVRDAGGRRSPAQRHRLAA